MTERGGADGAGTAGARRRRWRWAVALWAVAAVVGGGATVWLQDSVPSTEPPRRQETDIPAPLLSADVEDYACPTDAATAGPSESRDVQCFYATTGP